MRFVIGFGFAFLLIGLMISDADIFASSGIKTKSSNDCKGTNVNCPGCDASGVTPRTWSNTTITVSDGSGSSKADAIKVLCYATGGSCQVVIRWDHKCHSTSLAPDLACWGSPWFEKDKGYVCDELYAVGAPTLVSIDALTNVESIEEG